MSSYSCVTARLTMRSVLQTHGDSRSRSGPVIGLAPRPSMASCYSRRRPRTSELYACTYIGCGPPSVWNPHGVGRRPKEQKENVTMNKPDGKRQRMKVRTVVTGHNAKGRSVLCDTRKSMGG